MVGSFRTFCIVGKVLSRFIDAKFECRRHDDDGFRKFIVDGIGFGVIGVESLGDPNVEYDVLSHVADVVSSFLTS